MLPVLPGPFIAERYSVGPALTATLDLTAEFSVDGIRHEKASIPLERGHGLDLRDCVFLSAVKLWR